MLKKRIINFILILIYIILTINNSICIYASQLPETSSPNIGVYALDGSLELLWGQNDEKIISVASLTKVMTALVAIDSIPDLNQEVIIDYNIIYNNLDPELSIAGISHGEILTYYDLISILLVTSAADSAIYLSYSLFDSYDIFIQKMNEKAKEIGMENTSFSNSTGLDDKNNYSTIEDMAKMLSYAIRNDTLREIMCKTKYTTTDQKITVYNTITKLSQGANTPRDHIVGGKTGTTENAGLCLLSFSQDEDVILIACITGSSMYSSIPYNLIDSENLYNYFITNYSKKEILSIDDELITLPVTLSQDDQYTFYCKEPILKYTDHVDKSKLELKYTGKNTLSYEDKIGSAVGYVDLYYDGKYINTINLIIDKEIKFSVTKWINENNKLIFITIIIIFITLLIIKKILKYFNKLTLKGP